MVEWLALFTLVAFGFLLAATLAVALVVLKVLAWVLLLPLRLLGWFVVVPLLFLLKLGFGLLLGVALLPLLLVAGLVGLVAF